MDSRRWQARPSPLDLRLRRSDDPADEAASGLEVRLFGPMEVCAGGRSLPRLQSRKGQWLLALLALRAGRDVDRGWLAGTLWPECAEADGRRNLRQSLHTLRLALGPEAGWHALECTHGRACRSAGDVLPTR